MASCAPRSAAAAASAISGGAPLGARLGHFYRGVGLSIYEGYGLARTQRGDHRQPDQRGSRSARSENWCLATVGPIETRIDARPLARAAGAEIVEASVDGLDVGARRLECEGRSPVPYDVLSLDFGSTTDGAGIPGVGSTRFRSGP